MAAYTTHKATAAGKLETLARKAARTVKYAPMPASAHAMHAAPRPFQFHPANAR